MGTAHQSKQHRAEHPAGVRGARGACIRCEKVIFNYTVRNVPLANGSDRLTGVHCDEPAVEKYPAGHCEGRTERGKDEASMSAPRVT
jgi:hypothetical protein